MSEIDLVKAAHDMMNAAIELMATEPKIRTLEAETTEPMPVVIPEKRNKNSRVKA